MTDAEGTVVIGLGTGNGELVAVEAGVKLLRKSIDLGGGQVASEEGNDHLDQLLGNLDEVITDAYREDRAGERPDPVELRLNVSTAVLLCQLFQSAERMGPDGVAMAAAGAGLRFDGTAEDFQAMHRQWADVADRIEALLPPAARPAAADPPAEPG